MLRKRERLSRAEFNRFFSSGKRSHSNFFQLVYSPHPNFHASVVVPKKIIRQATKRNKLRRRIYDILRVYSRHNQLAGVHIVLVKKNPIGISYEPLKDELVSLIGHTNK